MTMSPVDNFLLATFAVADFFLRTCAAVITYLATSVSANFFWSGVWNRLLPVQVRGGQFLKFYR